MEILTQYTRRPREARPQFEGPFEVTQTEQSGWIPPGLQVARMIRAGERLAQWRKEAFDFQRGEEPSLDDPPVQIMDKADAAMQLHELGVKMREKQLDIERKKRVKSSQTDGGGDDDEKGTESGGERVQDNADADDD